MMSITKRVTAKVKATNPSGQQIDISTDVVEDGFMLFFNCQHLLIQLGKEARSFYDYLCEKMNIRTNAVIIDQSFKAMFIDHIYRLTSRKVNPSMNSLNTYVSDLKKLGLIITAVKSQRGYYIVNPKYAYKGSKQNRIVLLKEMIKERIQEGESVKGLIDSPLSTLP